jgi:hypothetical protein
MTTAAAPQNVIHRNASCVKTGIIIHCVLQMARVFFEKARISGFRGRISKMAGEEGRKSGRGAQKT